MGKTKRKSTLPVTVSLKPPGADLGEIIPLAVPKVRKILRARVFGSNNDRKEIFDIGFADEKRQLVEVLKKCVEFGESNSAILVGPRGVGKSVLLQSALKEITEFSDSYFYVYLNGLIQTDDRVALQEIARQLELENVIGDKVYGSFADNLAFILESLKQGNQETKSVVFVLDEFDLFALHKNQALLYNLLDVAQFKQCPVAVIGITCRLDVMELLEKRVKSRYSHRCILVYSSSKFDDYGQMMRKLLSLPDDFMYPMFKDVWQDKVETLLNDLSVRDELQHMYNRKREIGGLLQCLTRPVTQLSTRHWYIQPKDIIESAMELCRDTKTIMLRGLSVLELCLVVAMQHLMDKREGDPFNFEMVFDEYLKFSKRQNGMTFKFEKAVALKALEHLISVEIVKPLDSMTYASLPKEFKSMILLVDRGQIQDTIKSYPECPTELEQWVQSMFA